LIANLGTRDDDVDDPPKYSCSMPDETFQPTPSQTQQPLPAPTTDTDEKLMDPESKLNSMEADSPEAGESWWIEILKTIGLSLVLTFGIRTFIAEARYIPSASMEPTLLINDRLIVEKVGYYFHPPERGDIVVFNPTIALQQKGFKDAFIKRVVGMPGDQVRIADGKVYINGQPLPEPYLPPYQVVQGLDGNPISNPGQASQVPLTTTLKTCGPNDPFLAKPEIVPADAYLVLGDNRDDSFDGRCWGFVPRSNIIGRAALRFWPTGRIGFIPAGASK
jgi:signal peptidase I